MGGAPSTKERIARLLAQAVAHGDGWVSGECLGEQLGVSRASVWKAVKHLREAGYTIEAVRNKGYRLVQAKDELSQEGVYERLSDEAKGLVALEVVQQTGSTNDDMKLAASKGAPEFTAKVAGEQTRGKGRRGRPFYSLGDCGVYLSMIVRPHWSIDRATMLTSASGVAVCHAIESAMPGCKALIKWVNDIYVRGQKVCGILTEASTDLESSGLSYAVVGIGVNVYAPEHGFPPEFSNRAGYLAREQHEGLRNTIAAGIISEVVRLYRARPFEGFVREYRERSYLDGKMVRVVGGALDGELVTVQGIDRNLRLVATDRCGDAHALNSGEVSIKAEIGGLEDSL